ncbi:RluA family pseudouridine synthase [Planctomicrobium sp. SH527]|uniref:RluA family pseudouridine synthase n=1 Tax=Planctomicrobium sp. SH527 TaxID=3448123 RepID=UPI003F5C7E40
MALEVVELTIEAEQVGRLDQLVQTMTGRSRSEARGLLDRDCVLLNGRPCKKGGLIVEAGSVVQVTHDPHTRYKEAKVERPPAYFRVLFEDEYLIVVDKGPGILTVQTDNGNQKTLIDSVTEYLRRRQRGARAVAVHRLDRDTSGTLVVAKNPKIAEQLMEQFRIRKAEREYAVLVAGRVMQKEGTFRTYMTTSKRLQRYSVGPGEQGELAITHFRVNEYLRDATYLTAILETGRRNQIRVHFAEVGHPVLGDDRYRPHEAKHPAWRSKGLGLHAVVLGFDHPVTGEAMKFEAPLPKDFERFLRSQSTKKRS